MVLHTTDNHQKASLNPDNNQDLSDEAQTNNSSQTSHSNRTFLQIVIITITYRKNSIKANAILDTNSDATLIRRDIYNI